MPDQSWRNPELQKNKGGQIMDLKLNIIEMARKLKRSLSRISKVKDEQKLLEKKNSINEAIPKIKARIEEIRTEGKSSTDVDVQRKLYFEGTELESLQKEINGKGKAIDDKLENLSPKQKAWFGIEDGKLTSTNISDHQVDDNNGGMVIGQSNMEDAN